MFCHISVTIPFSPLRVAILARVAAVGWTPRAFSIYTRIAINVNVRSEPEAVTFSGCLISLDMRGTFCSCTYTRRALSTSRWLWQCSNTGSITYGRRREAAGYPSGSDRCEPCSTGTHRGPNSTDPVV